MPPTPLIPVFCLLAALFGAPQLAAAQTRLTFAAPASPAPAPHAAGVPPTPVAGPPALNTRAWSVGVGLTSGLAGAELLQRPWLRVGTGVGAGAGGLGARVVLWPILPFEGWLWDRLSGNWWPYASAGFLYTPWAGGDFDASGAYGAELGMQRWGQEGSVFVDLAGGAARTAGGEWHGRRVVPTVRIAFGYAWPF